MAKNKEVDINDTAITLEVDRESIDKVRNGEVTNLVLYLNESIQNLILENVNGNLVLKTKNMPAEYHGCYYYNRGRFPYLIKDTLRYLVLTCGDDCCLTRILETEPQPGTRFRFQGPDKPSIEDPKGDCCVWGIAFMIVPFLDNSRVYLMRWNPSISSFTEQDYKKCVANMKHGAFPLNWSISEWEEARCGDVFYMLRVGDNKSGIVFNGQFVNDPYPGEDWAGSTKRRMYVDMACMNSAKPRTTPALSMDKLQTAIPEFDWSKGHSGILLPDNVAKKLQELMAQFND